MFMSEISAGVSYSSKLLKCMITDAINKEAYVSGSCFASHLGTQSIKSF